MTSASSEEYKANREESWPLRTIWLNEMLLQEVSFRQLQAWAIRRNTGNGNGFPEPDQVLGRYVFYLPEEVLKWYKQWRKTNRPQGTHLNVGRTNA